MKININNIKYIFKFIVLNLLILLALLLLFDYILFAKELYRPEFMGVEEGNLRVENDLEYDKNKKSVITVGCSFTYGSGLDLTDIFSYKLQKLTKRKTYNRGFPSWDPRYILRDIQLSNFFNRDKIVEPEYVIYTFISDHMRRMYVDYFCKTTNCNRVMNLYKIKNDELILRPQRLTFKNYLEITEIGRQLNWFVYKSASQDKQFDRLKLYLFAMKKELQARYPDVKFAVIVYHPEIDTYNHFILPFRTERWNEIEEAGITVIRFDTPEYDFLKEPEYISKIDRVHPSGQAWDELLPVIIERLNL